MKDQDNEAFINLFGESYQKCFGVPLTSPMSETESKHFVNKVYEETGLVIGAKSVKNYSIYILSPSEGKRENPSAATLDTLARFVFNAPYTDETKRKANESHYPYWFQYKSKNGTPDKKKFKKSPFHVNYILITIGVILIIIFCFYIIQSHQKKILLKQILILYNLILSQKIAGL